MVLSSRGIQSILTQRDGSRQEAHGDWNRKLTGHSCISTQKAENEQEMVSAYKASRPTPSDSFLPARELPLSFTIKLPVRDSVPNILTHETLKLYKLMI